MSLTTTPPLYLDEFGNSPESETIKTDRLLLPWVQSLVSFTQNGKLLRT